jgi:hypothetical protein
MRRRTFLFGVLGGGLVACVTTPDDGDEPAPEAPDASASTTPDAAHADAGPDVDACSDTVTMYDTNAQALYLDGSLGPLTGVIEVEYIVAGAAITLDFWHGHSGQQHRFTLLPEHYDALKRGERVYVGTTEVDDHSHMLFIDPVDPDYRVAGAQGVEVPVC